MNLRNHKKSIWKSLSFFLIIISLSVNIVAENNLSVSIDVNDEDGVLYNERFIQAFLDIKNSSQKSFKTQINWKISTDDWQPLMEITIPYTVKKTGTTTAYCPLFEFPGPGFYHISGNVMTKTGENYSATKVIGIDPEQITEPKDPQPDFKEFWKSSLNELENVTPKYHVIPQNRNGNTKTDLFKVEMQSVGGITVRGWLEVPKKKGVYPVLLRVPGYQENMTPIDMYDDMIVFSFNTRDHGESGNTGKRDYAMWVRGFESEKKYYYRGLYLDCIRAIDYLVSRKDVDESRIAVWGGSQGGGLSFATAALDDRIDLCIADIPFLCEMQRYLEITHWSEVDDWFAAHPDKNWQDILKTLSYFDTKNMAHWIKCPVIMGIGLQDDVCPPATSFVTYNYIKSPKEYTIYKNEFHWQPESHYVDRFQRLRKFFNMD